MGLERESLAIAIAVQQTPWGNALQWCDDWAIALYTLHLKQTHPPITTSCPPAPFLLIWSPYRVIYNKHTFAVASLRLSVSADLRSTQGMHWKTSGPAGKSPTDLSDMPGRA